MSTEYGFSFLARYGQTILSGGIAAIPVALFHYQREIDLTPQEIWFISYILAHKWDERLPYPSLVRMAERSGISYRTLHRYKDSLVEKGYLEVISRETESGGQDSNAYDFTGLFIRLEELVLEQGSTTPMSQGSMTPMSQGSMTPMSYKEEEREIEEKGRRYSKDSTFSQTSHNIERIAIDFSRQIMHDEEHINSNTTQMHNIWHQSGLSEEEFIDVVYQARKIVLNRSSQINKLANPQFGLKNRAPYFFTVLKNLVEEATQSRSN